MTHTAAETDDLDRPDLTRLATLARRAWKTALLITILVAVIVFAGSAQRTRARTYALHVVFTPAVVGDITADLHDRVEPDAELALLRSGAVESAAERSLRRGVVVETAVVSTTPRLALSIKAEDSTTARARSVAEAVAAAFGELRRERQLNVLQTVRAAVVRSIEAIEDDTIATPLSETDLVTLELAADALQDAAVSNEIERLRDAAAVIDATIASSMGLEAATALLRRSAFERTLDRLDLAISTSGEIQPTFLPMGAGATGSSTLETVALAVLVGAVLGVGVAWGRAWFRGELLSPRDVEAAGVRVLVTIPSTADLAPVAAALSREGVATLGVVGAAAAVDAGLAVGLAGALVRRGRSAAVAGLPRVPAVDSDAAHVDAGAASPDDAGSPVDALRLAANVSSLRTTNDVVIVHCDSTSTADRIDLAASVDVVLLVVDLEGDTRGAVQDANRDSGGTDVAAVVVSHAR